jgi:NADH dehydrogenase FAD-containing subunit
MSPPTATDVVPKQVLVIGAGAAGLSTMVGLRALNKDCAITLVEPKAYGEIPWGAYRAPFEEWVRKGGIFPLAAFCAKNKVTHKQTLVQSLSKTAAVLASGETIEFDVCVLAIGATLKWKGFSRGPLPLSVDERLTAAKSAGDELLAAASVLIVGGGLIGTELTGDLAAYAAAAKNTTIQITLVHSGEHLCPEMSPAAAARVKEQLEAKGVRVILNERATPAGEGKYTLKSGEAIEAAQVVMTTGLASCSHFLKGGDLADCVNEQGWITTDDYFRVVDAGGQIFALGDCCTTLPNAAVQVLQNIAVMGHNVQASLDGPADEAKLKKFSLGPAAYLATTGTDQGVADMGGGYWTTWFLPWLKQKTMFYFRPRMELGLTSVE